MMQPGISDYIFSRLKSLVFFCRRWLVVALTALLISACGGGGDDFPGDVQADAEVRGGAIKGPLIGALATIFILDLDAPDMKGAIVGSGTTDEFGRLNEVYVDGAAVSQAPLLIEYTGGTEINLSTPLFSTLRAVATLEQLQNGVPVYATTLTTMVVELARIEALKAADPAAAYANVLLNAQQTVKDQFGLGLLGPVDMFATRAFVQFNAPPAAFQADLDLALRYRTAIEVAAAVVAQLNDLDINVSADEILLGITQDLSDGIPDAQIDGVPIPALAGIGAVALRAVLGQSPAELAALIVPGTAGDPAPVTIAEINQLLVDEALVITPGIVPNLLAPPTIGSIVPGIDSDGDGVVDALDQFPDDPTRAGDSDMDGFDDLVDVFPDDINEWADTDGDGVGDNGDVFPNDPNRQTLADNNAPVADAGMDATVLENTVTPLDGSSSSDADGDPLSYNWQFTVVPPGSAAALTGETTANPTFTPDLLGLYTVQLTVDDGFANSMDSVTITVINDGSNDSPVANAGPDQQIPWGNTVTQVNMDGTGSSDPDMDALTYAWAIIDFVPEGDDPAVPVTLVNEDTATPSFTVNSVDQLGTYTLRLTVSDGQLQTMDDVVVAIQKNFPVASVLFGSGVAGFAFIGLRNRRRQRQLNTQNRGK